jgi:arabinose-5-phosphate isomerase
MPNQLLNIRQNLQEVLVQEANALTHLSEKIDATYDAVVQAILQCQGKIVVTGLGKSGLVGKKIAATLTSTGTPAVFLHAAEALHGDLGIVAANDIVLAISKGGEQNELNAMMPAIKRIGARVVALTASIDSSLAKAADWVLHIPMKKEACPHDLAPTVSSTLSMAVGDAVAMAVMRARGFKREDFALFHPGGKLGRRLLLQVSDLLVPLEKCPMLPSSSEFEQVLNSLTKYGLGMVMFGQGTTLEGILTDGDVRRILAREREKVFSIRAHQVMIRSPFVVQAEKRAFEALEAMENRSSPINVAPVINARGQIQGAVRLHDLLQAS